MNESFGLSEIASLPSTRKARVHHGDEFTVTVYILTVFICLSLKWKDALYRNDASSPPQFHRITVMKYTITVSLFSVCSVSLILCHRSYFRRQNHRPDFPSYRWKQHGESHVHSQYGKSRQH